MLLQSVCIYKCIGAYMQKLIRLCFFWVYIEHFSLNYPSTPLLSSYPISRKIPPVALVKYMYSVADSMTEFNMPH